MFNIGSYFTPGYPKQFSLTRMHLKEDGEFELSWNNNELICSDNSSNTITLYWCEKNMYQVYECNVCKIIIIIM